MNPILHQPKNTMPRIESLYAFLSVDPDDGNEGIVAAPIRGLTMPLIAADEKRLECLKPIAKAVGELAPKIKIRLVKFTKREDQGFIT